jgi:hypothetical protein
MPPRIDLGRILLAAGAVLLLISLFVEWYAPGLTGWRVFESLDVILAGLAIAALVVVFRGDADAPAPAWGVPAAVIFIVGVQLIDQPPAADGPPQEGAWLALAAGLLMAAGSALSLASIAVTVHVREREVRRRVAAVDGREPAPARREPAAGGRERVIDRREPAADRREPVVDRRHDPPATESDAAPGSSSLFADPPVAGDPGMSGRAGASRPSASTEDPDRTQPLSAIPEEDPGPRSRAPYDEPPRT